MLCYLCRSSTHQRCCTCGKPICASHRFGVLTDAKKYVIQVMCVLCRQAEIQTWKTMRHDGDGPSAA